MVAAVGLTEQGLTDGSEILTSSQLCRDHVSSKLESIGMLPASRRTTGGIAESNAILIKRPQLSHRIRSRNTLMLTRRKKKGPTWS
jgi:hypothetical protein